VPDLVAGFENVAGERAVLGGGEVLVELRHAGRAENDDVGSGVVQQPVQSEADERAVGVTCDLAEFFDRDEVLRVPVAVLVELVVIEARPGCVRFLAMFGC